MQIRGNRTRHASHERVKSTNSYGCPSCYLVKDPCAEGRGREHSVGQVTRGVHDELEKSPPPWLSLFLADDSSLDSAPETQRSGPERSLALVHLVAFRGGAGAVHMCNMSVYGVKRSEIGGADENVVARK